MYTDELCYLTIGHDGDAEVFLVQRDGHVISKVADRLGLRGNCHSVYFPEDYGTHRFQGRWDKQQNIASITPLVAADDHHLPYFARLISKKYGCQVIAFACDGTTTTYDA